MSSSWIQVRTDLPDDPRIIQLALSMGIPEEHALGCVIKFWAWVDKHAVDGHANVTVERDTVVTHSWLDRHVGHDGFSDGMVKIGWLVTSNGHIEIPDWSTWFSKSAKARALTTKRKQKERHGNVTPKRDKSVTKEEKRKEEKNKKNPLPPLPDDLKVMEKSWNDWVAYKSSRKEKLAPQTANRLFSKFRELGVGWAVAAINHTIEKGWQGLRHPEDSDGRQRTFAVMEGQENQSRVAAPAGKYANRKPDFGGRQDGSTGESLAQ